MRAVRIGCIILGVGLAAIVGSCCVQIVAHDWRERQAGTCGKHMAQLRNALIMYCKDHGGRLPSAAHWCDAVLPYVDDRSVFVCPTARNRTCSYAFNAAVSGLVWADIEKEHRLAVLFESDGGWNAAGGPELLPKVPRHLHGGEHLLRADGSTGFERRSHRRLQIARDVWPEEWLREYQRGIEWAPPILKEPPEAAPPRRR
jgi:hypothetical protein